MERSPKRKQLKNPKAIPNPNLKKKGSSELDPQGQNIITPVYQIVLHCYGSDRPVLKKVINVALSESNQNSVEVINSNYNCCGCYCGWCCCCAAGVLAVVAGVVVVGVVVDVVSAVVVAVCGAAVSVVVVVVVVSSLSWFL